MNSTRSLYGCVSVALLLLAGCATVPIDETSQGASPQQDLANEARDYRAQSYTLWDMADRRQAEAEVLSQELGPDHAEVQLKLRLAEELQKAALEADRQARDTRRQVPHGMVQ